MSDGNDAVCVTIKYGKGFEEPWAVFRGSNSQVRADIADYFGFDLAALAGMTTNEVVTLAVAKAQGMASAAAQLGAVSIASPVTTVMASSPAADGVASADEDPWAEDAQAEPVDPNAALLVAIEQIASVDGLKAFYADNQAAWNDVLMAAYKARGRALVAAS